jgi:exodeoxyribonuclease V gamma subunit
MLHIHTSNRLENLLQALATVVKVPLANPLAKEIIVVQSQGMQRWVSIKLAEEIGIWANGAFPFADAIVWRLFKEVLGYLPDTSPFEPEILVWNIMAKLPTCLAAETFTEINHYLQDDPQQIKQLQLAIRLATLFNQYLIYRPHWLISWENNQQPPELQNNPVAQWQALLWQTLVKHIGNNHRAKLRTEFFQQLAKLNSPPSHWQRLSIFGIPALPPFHLEVFARLGQLRDIHIFLLNPCQEYWGDIVSDIEIAHKTARIQKKSPTPEELYFTRGNPLLASWGKMGRDFIDLLQEYPHVSHEYFPPPTTTTLLAHIQTDILYLRERIEVKATPLQVADDSIQIHVCHSPLREIEVLHDQLLALFETNPSLLPKDIVVMVPEIETYAPFIEAVFATTPEEAKQIPFSIADRSWRNQSTLIDAFMAILELSQSRLTVSEVLKILEITAVQNRFGFLEADLDLIRWWIKQTGIRWGIDAADREQMNLPAVEANTWRAGLQRLLLGYALPASPLFQAGQLSTEPQLLAENREEFLFQGILPFDQIDGSERVILGKFVAFIEQLFDYIKALEQTRTLPQWSNLLNELFEQLLSPDENSEFEAQQIRQLLTTLVKHHQLAQVDTKVSREVMLAYLRHYLEKEPSPTHFLTGQVLFCTLLPMRSIPFKVVALLGMNDQTYPRPSQSLSFDLITQHPQRGDRSRRQHDRYLFLEALLSARTHFYLSYVGRSIHDDTVIAPSVLISELLDYIQHGFIHPHYDAILDYLVIHHPLQAFSPRYFNGEEPRLFSYSKEYCVASTALFKDRQLPHQFFPAPFPEPQPLAEWQTVEIKRLTRFFANPTEFLFQQRLGIKLPTEQDLLDKTEPFTIRGLERYTLSQTLVAKSLAGQDLTAYQHIAKASGQLPHGQIGDYVYHQLVEQIQPFVERVRQVTQQDQREGPRINLNLGEMRLIGRLNGIWPDHLIYYRYAKLKAKDYINTWIYHLILNALPNDNLPRQSLLIGEDGEWCYQPLDPLESQTILMTLLTEYYWQGLSQPLLFFPQSALTFAKAIHRGKSTEEALDRAWQTWRGNEFAQGEADNEYYQLNFGQTDSNSPLKERHFQVLAQQFFEPLLKNLVSADKIISVR